jgi:hypothetical protein
MRFHPDRRWPIRRGSLSSENNAGDHNNQAAHARVSIAGNLIPVWSGVSLRPPREEKDRGARSISETFHRAFCQLERGLEGEAENGVPGL